MADNPEPGSMFIENEDGSHDRIGEVPEYIRKLAAEKGYTIIPDHVPADQVAKWFYQPGKPAGVTAAASDSKRRYPRWGTPRTTGRK